MKLTQSTKLGDLAKLVRRNRFILSIAYESGRWLTRIDANPEDHFLGEGETVIDAINAALEQIQSRIRYI